ncbi:uncharacterized protein LOC125139371 isoform X1, partial [Tachysurus ichikawai]
LRDFNTKICALISSGCLSLCTLNFFFTSIIHLYIIFRNLNTINTKLERFEIPWQRLPEELIQNLERQKRPTVVQDNEEKW